MLVSECCKSIPYEDTFICAECMELANFIKFNPFSKYKYYNPNYHEAYKKAEKKIKEKQNEQ